MSKSTRGTEKGSAIIPKELGEKHDLAPGDEVVWIETDEGIVKNAPVPALAGYSR